jgi:hypothetical protein
MEYELCPLDMPQEAVAEAGAFGRAFYQAGNVRDDEGAEIAHIDDAEVRFEGRERVVRDLGFCRGDDGNKCRFSGVGETNKTDIRYQFQFKLQFLFLAGAALIMKFWGPPRRGRKMSIAPPALSALCDKMPLSGFGKIEFKLVVFGVQDLRSNRDLDRYVLAVLSRPVRTFSVPSAFGLVLRVEAEMQQRIQPLVRFHPNTSADTSITSARAPARHEFFAPEGRDAIAAVTSLDLYFYSVDKHFRI